MSRAKDAVLSAVTKYIHPALLATLDEQAEFADLKLHPLDRHYSFPLEIEERLGIEFGGDDIERWVTLGDMIRSAERLMACEAA